MSKAKPAAVAPAPEKPKLKILGDQPPPCRHAEAVIVTKLQDGTIFRRLVPGHSCIYVDRRNALIPAAERLANKQVAKIAPKFMERPAAHPSWTKLFLAAMDQLWAEANTSLPPDGGGNGAPALPGSVRYALDQIERRQLQ